MATITDINAECRDLCDTDTTGYTAAALLRRINEAYEKVAAFIIGCDGLWQWDDSNYTNFPVGTTTLVNSQNDYAFDSAMLEIERVEVLDSGSIWHLLSPIDISQVSEAMDEFQKNDGLPIYYDKKGSSVVLYPAPATGSVTLAAGLKVHFKRTASIFTAAEVTTGTKEPGFASPFHYILAYIAAIPYCMKYKKDRVALYEVKVQEYFKLIEDHYGRREQDRRKRITMGGISSK